MANISVIIPVYNVEDYLQDCLESVLAQDEDDIEIICINDGSTDKSLEILEKYANSDDRFVVFSQENSGLAQARNKGLELATGKYVCFLDSDDMLAPNVLKELYTVAKTNDVDFVSYEIKLLFEDDSLYREDVDRYYRKEFSYPGIRTGRDFFVEMIENGEYVDSACLLFINREWLKKKKISFYPGIYYEDALFALFCFFQSDIVIHLDLKAYIYRVRKKSIMTNHSYRFLNVYSCLINYRETMRLLLSIPDNEQRLSSALIRYMHLIVGKIRYFDEYRSDREYVPDLSEMDSFLEAVFGVGAWRATPEDRLMLKGLEKIAEDSNGIILYGAGHIGEMVFHYLKDHNLDDKVICFAVSKNNEDKKSAFGKEIKEISELKNCSAQFIMSAGRGIQSDMRKRLMELGIEEYIGIDRYTEGALERYFRK